MDCDRKFRNFWGSTRAVRRLNDTICIENGLSIVENPKLHGKRDQYIAEYEQTLEDIKNGLLVSKSVNGDDECMTTFNPNWVGSTTD